MNAVPVNQPNSKGSVQQIPSFKEFQMQEENNLDEA